MALEKVIYVAHATATGGRDGRAVTSDNKLDVALARPTELGGNGQGTNPEQLFAAGYAACFIGAMGFVAGQSRKFLPAGTQIASEVGIGPIPAGFGIEVTLNITLPGLPKDEAQALIDAAHQVCPYSNATRGNIQVTLNLV
ncbi:MAG TPA: organic hydroperoxide resistance protein [Aquabacterium sp.]|uniref:organic hydroperoxide resistance protein n=1 Tax=Aquabacterium sp. TaxID=1872578 RepID=UPI002E366456|nr:organic hydroperoxide resistance protein [Aquabacterium sp.]HEX5354775.1 organic hydroperoxide resistance protein [Aquabacterium sp.]